MKNKRLFILLSLFLYSALAIGQIKNEKEERIKFSDLPEHIQTIAETLPKNARRIKFYKETDGYKKSFEIKLKYEGLSYSIEFSETEHLEDIEVLSNFKDLKQNAKNRIINYFETSYLKNRIIKVQNQFVFDKKYNPSIFIDTILIKQNVKPNNYEIIAEVRTSKKREIREFTFNAQGFYKKSREVNPRSYEYVLY